MIRSNAVASCAAAIAHLGSAATYDGVRPARLAIGRPLTLWRPELEHEQPRTRPGSSVHGLRVPRLQPFVVLEHVIERAVDDDVEPGHSSIAITGDIYGHTPDATTRAAIDGLTNALGLS